MNEGVLRLQLSSSTAYGTVSHVAECPDIGPACFSADPPEPFNHHVRLFMTDINLMASYGLNRLVALETRWTLGIARMDAEFSNLDGSPRNNPGDEIHHRDETLVGPRDPWLLVRLGGARGALSASARFGFSFPVGRTEPDPYRAGQRGEVHQHLQFGSGTIIPIVGGSLSYAFEPVELSLTGLGLFSLYENHEGYRAPTRLFGIFRVTVPLGAAGQWRPYADLTLSHEGAEIWHGQPGGEGFFERRELYVGGGLAWQFVDGWEADLALRGRVAKLTSAPSFNTPGVLQVGLSVDLDLR